MNTFVVCLLLVPLVCAIGLREEFTWTKLNYVKISSRYNTGAKTGYHSPIVFPNDEDPQLISDDDYIFENNIPMGANRWKNKLFITVPRRRPGIPSTLNYVWVNSTKKHNVPLVPYPDVETNRLNEDGSFSIVSVYRVAVDACNRLWMVDTGKLEFPGNATQFQPPSILIFDLSTDTLIRRYIFTEGVYHGSSTLADITVDVSSSNCNDAYAYIPDVSGYALIVYSFQQDDSWRVKHNYFYLEPLAGEMSIGGFNFQWDDGIFSIVLSAVQEDGYRDAYFHSMAGVHIYSVSTRILKDKDLATRSYHGNDFKVIGHREFGYQSSASALYQPNGILFLGLINKNALGCFNTLSKTISNPLQTGIIQQDDEKMIYPSDVKIYKNEVIVLTNSMPVFAYGHLDYSKTNFRVWLEDVDKAIEGTLCEPERS